MIPLRCAWRGCEANFVGLPLPTGWIGLVTYRNNKIPGLLDFARDRVKRDAVLCPQHAEELERCLMPL